MKKSSFPQKGVVAQERVAEPEAAGRRILARLAEPGMRAERRGDQLVLLKSDQAVSLSSGFPVSVLAPLIESGAARCAIIKGRSAFIITRAGRARLARERADEAPYAAQHRELVDRVIEVEGERQTIRVNVADDVLELFRRRRIMPWLVGKAQLEAGERLQRDFVLARTAPQTTANWSRLVVDGAGHHSGLTRSEVTIEAGLRVGRALRAVGPDFSGILVDALAFSKGIEVIEREHSLPARSGKVLLAYALRNLARHYGLSDEARGAEARAIRHWGAEDYRPGLHTG